MKSLVNLRQSQGLRTKVVFKVNVTNLGPDSDTVDLTVSGQHLSWASLAQDSAQLASGASQVIDLTVTIPSNAVPEAYDIMVTGTLKSNTNRTKSMKATAASRRPSAPGISSTASGSRPPS